MPDSVVARVADRLEILPEQTDRVLRTLAQLIKKQSARDGRVRVPGLGVFQQADDTLVFEPDPVLAETVNVRYAGLETVPLSLAPEVTAGRVAVETLDETETITEDETPSAPDLSAPPPIPHELEHGPPTDFAEEEPVAQEFALDTVAGESVDAEEPVLEEEPFEEEMAFEDESEAAEEQVAEELEEPAAIDESEASEAPPHSFMEPTNFDDPDISEAAAYENPQDETDDIEEDTQGLGEEEASEWAPSGPAWSKHDLEALIQESTQETDEAAQDLPEETLAPATDTNTEEDKAEEEEVEAFFDTLSDEKDSLPPSLPPTPKVRKQEKPRRRSALPWVLLISAVMVVGMAILYLLDLPPFSPTGPDTPPAITETTPTAPPGQAATDPQTPTDEAPTPTDEAPTPTDETETPPDTPSQAASTRTPTSSAQGLDRNQGGYTLVVASFPERAVAEAEVERFRQRLNDPSIPVDVVQGESNGRIRYRVAVGQVPTAAEATALLSRLSDSVPQGTWVTSIPSDS